MIDHQSEDIARLLEAVDTAAREKGARAYVVGGVVRDLLVQEDKSLVFRDIDVLVEGDAREVAQVVAPRIAGKVELYDRFLTAKIVRATFPFEVDLASARQERYERPGALPTVTFGSLLSDLERRDFTMNAMALPLMSVVGYLRGTQSLEQLRGEVIDPLGGLRDLNERIVRILHPLSFHDDPTRLFRAVRYSARFGAALCPETERAFQLSLDKGAAGGISVHRVLQEVRKVVMEVHPGVALHHSIESGLAGHFLGLDDERSRQVPPAVERLVVHRSWLTPLEWWHVVQWLLVWAGMERSERVEAALGRRQRELKALYREVDDAQSSALSGMASDVGVIAWYGLTGEGADRVGILQAERRINGT